MSPDMGISGVILAYIVSAWASALSVLTGMAMREPGIVGRAVVQTPTSSVLLIAPRGRQGIIDSQTIARLMKLLKKLLLSFVLMCGSAGYSTAQNGFFYDVNLNFSNVYLSTASNLVQMFVPGLLRGDMISYDVNYLSIKDNGEDVSIKKANYAGFKADDLFSWVETSVKFGWFGKASPVGIYASIAYDHQRYQLCLQHDSGFGRYRTNALKPGIGIRFIPFRASEVMPMIEVGTNYTLNFGVKSPYGTDKDQFNNGVSYTFSAGVSWMDFYDNMRTVRVGVTIAGFDYLNRDWSSDGGFYFPYANVKSRNYKFFIKYTQYF